MDRKLLLRIAGGLVLFTAVGHTIGIFAPPPEDAQIQATIKAMELTLMPMPFGAPRSFMTVMNGLSITCSIYLVVAGLTFLVQARSIGERSLLVLNSAGVLAAGVVALLCFFPLPAACLLAGATCGFLALRSAGRISSAS